MPLEESPEAFLEAFANHRVSLKALPRPVGDPILTLLTPFGPLAVFDRGLPLGTPGTVEVLLHAVVKAKTPGQRAGILHLPGGRHQIGGRVTADLGGGFYRFEIGEIPVVLFSPQPLAGTLTVKTAPVMMGFRP